MQYALIAKAISGFKMVKSFFTSLLPFKRKLLNLFCRPSLRVELRPKVVVFKIPNNNNEHHIHYVSLLITNKSKNEYIIPFHTIKIGNEPFYNANAGFYYNDILKSEWISCDSRSEERRKDNHLDILQGRYYITAKPHIGIIFPLSDALSAYSSYKKNSLLFFPKNKISISLMINSKSYEYGLKRIEYLELYANHLSSRISQFGFK
ncbi:MAG: hypothetical protein M1561_08345 [Gammaproteobacteria bacterium]|nr:hypothetical protein [Gammaproteobacteria bacterium]